MLNEKKRAEQEQMWASQAQANFMYQGEQTAVDNGLAGGISTSGLAQAHTTGVCPSCGYCSCCGRKNQDLVPYSPSYPYYIYQSPTTTIPSIPSPFTVITSYPYNGQMNSGQ